MHPLRAKQGDVCLLLGSTVLVGPGIDILLTRHLFYSSAGTSGSRPNFTGVSAVTVAWMGEPHG